MRARGQTLMCCATALQDLEFEVDVPALAGAGAATGPRRWHASVERLERLAPDVMRLTLALPAAEAFWKGDADQLADLVSDEMLANFRAAIESRKAAGQRLENRLLQVDRAQIVGARMNGAMAEITVRFDAEIVSVTRDAEGRVIAGDPGKSVETHDLWTFSRHTTSSDPAWLLVETDEEA
jgi:predicted lipid-binding transport protein (Tim44 family)